MDTRKFKKPYKPRFISRKDYSHTKTFGAAPLATLPDELIKLPPQILDQGNIPCCTAAASCTARSIMTGRIYDVMAQWALELKYKGVSDSEGFPLNVPAEVGKKLGFCPSFLGAPTGDQVKPIDPVEGYFWITSKLPGMDWFDTLCYTQFQLFQKTGKVIPFQFAINWYSEWDNAPQGFIPTTQNNLLGGHDTTWAGSKKFPDGVRRGGNAGTWGAEIGDQGVFWFDREATNKNIGTLGVFYYLDKEDMPLTPQEVGVAQKILQNIKAIVILISNSLNKNGTYPPPESLTWDTPQNARHAVRVICDQEGLTVSDKNILCACVQVESNFNPQAIHFNKDKNGQIWSTDYGISQINDFYNIGVGKPFPSSDYVLTNPEACIRFMCKQWLAGNQHLWASYTSGLYKKYL